LQVVASLVAQGLDVNVRNRGGDSPLDMAIKADQTAVAEFLIAHGATVNAKDNSGWSPLHFAASRNNRALVALLLSHHADVTARDVEGLPPQRRATSEDVLALFAYADSEVGSRLATAVDRAACEDVLHTGIWRRGGGVRDVNLADNPRDPSDDWQRLDNVDAHQTVRLQNRDYELGVGDGPTYLARKGADGVWGVVCEFAASESTQSPTYHVMSGLERLQASSSRDFVNLSQEAVRVAGLWGAQALWEASQRRDKPIPLAAESDENPLGDAIKAHRDDILRFYLEHGVDPNLKPLEHSRVDGLHSSPTPDDPLFTAVKSGTPDAVSMLLDHGANPDAMGDMIRQPVLAWAVREGRVALVETLLEHGADPNLPPSSYAVFQTLDDILRRDPLADAQVDAVHRLLLHGADPSPWIFVAFQHYTRAKGREDLLSLTLYSRKPVQAEWLQSAISSPGPQDTRVEAMLRDAIAIRDSGVCREGASPSESAICLPNTLKSADSAVDARFAHASKEQQRPWLAELDHKCDLHALSSLTRAGWQAYVLSNNARSQCVVGEMLQQRVGKSVTLN
jgi:ankyrin repeat protein